MSTIEDNKLNRTEALATLEDKFKVVREELAANSNFIPATAPIIEAHLIPTIDSSPPISCKQHPVRAYLLRCSPGSRKTILQSLDVVAAELSPDGAANAMTLDWSSLRYEHTTLLRAALIGKHQYAHTTINKILTFVRQVLQEARYQKLMHIEHYESAVFGLKPVKGHREPVGRNITPGEIAALLQAATCTDYATAARDQAILAVLRAGLRRQEAVELRLEDVQPDGSLLVKGKGNKQRIVPLPKGAIVTLRSWIDLRGSKPGALLWAVYGCGHLYARELSPQTINVVLQKLQKRANVEPLTPHDFRRTLVGDLSDAGVDLIIIQKIVGHNDISTTSRYDRRGERAEKKAIDLIHFPCHQS